MVLVKMFSRMSRDFNIKLQSSPDQAHFNFGLLFGKKEGDNKKDWNLCIVVSLLR